MFVRLSSAAARTAGARPRAVYARSVANARRNHAPASPTAGSAQNGGSSLNSANARRITDPDPQAAPRPVADDTTRGVNSADFFGGPSGTASRLRAALNAALHPGAGATVDPEAVLVAVKGYVASGLEVPISHRNSVSSILAKHYASTPVDDADVVALADVLAAICLDPRALAATTAKSGKNHYAVSARYARWLAAEAQRGDGERVRRVLDALERQLAALGARASGGAPLPPAQGAAWAMLRARAAPSNVEAEAADQDISLRLPTYESVVAQAERLGADATDAGFVGAATALFRDDAATLPTTVRALEGRLAFLRGHHRLAQVQALWDAFAPLLDARDSTHGLIRDDGGAAALGAFYTALAPRSNELVADRDALTPYLDAVKARFPSPTPLPILHALLRASRPGELDGLAGLDAETTGAAGPSTAPTAPTTGPRRDRDVVLAAAKTTWDRVRAEGVTPDVQAYRIYLGLLGHHGEWLAMLQLWDDLIANEATRALWQDELRKNAGPEGVSETELNGAYEPTFAVLTTAWPPTVVLNQVLSSAFMIGRRAAEVAMGLFKVAITPESQLAVDVVTVNTVLRWAAHLADVGMINEVISTAGRLKIKPDIITYTTIVHGLLRADRPDLARATLDAMRSRGVEPNDRMASMLVGDLAAEGTADGLRRAEDVIRDMRARGIRTTTPMWTSLVGGYFSGGWQLDGWDALARMRQHGHKLNDKGYNIVLRQVTRGSAPRARGERGGARKGRAQVAQPDADADGADSPAIRLFRRMVADGVVPNADTYTILLDPLVAARRAREVDEVLADMDRRRFTTLRPALNRMIREARRLTRQRERQR